MYRASLVRAMAHHPAIQAIVEASDGRETLEAIAREQPEVAVVDLHMPGLDGLAIINAVERDGLATKIVLLSGTLEERDVYDALARGAAAVLTKSIDAPELLDAVLAVARGETVVAEELQSAVASQIRLRAADERPILSEREAQVLRGMAGGQSIREIAEALYLSPSTVKSHTERLYVRLGVNDRAAAVAEGLRRGLIE